MSGRSMRIWCLLLAVVAVASSACSDNDRSEPQPSPSTASVDAAESLDVREAAERAALEAYRGMLDAWVEAAQTSDPDAPGLREHATGEALAAIVESLLVDRERGVVTRGELLSTPEVISVEPVDQPTTVWLRDCSDDSNWLKYYESGELLNDVPGGRHEVTAVVMESVEGWQVTSFAAQGAGTC